MRAGRGEYAWGMRRPRSCRIALTLSIAAAAGLPLAGCGSSAKPGGSASGGGSFYVQRVNPGTQGFVPWLNDLTTATRSVPEQVVALEGFQTVGVAVTPSGRLFLSSPRWHGRHGSSVIELFPGTSQPPRAYPDPEWNRWGPGKRPEESFVCVQALHVDDAGRFWVLDPGAPSFEGPIDGAAKLMRFDTQKNRIAANFVFSTIVAPPGSYLNDVRIDTARGFAYISDSGLGAIVGVDLTTGTAARFLEFDPSTKAEPGTRLTIGDKPWVNETGFSPEVHCDGIALSPDGEYLYYQALTGRTLYRVPTAPMRAALRGPAGGPMSGTGDTATVDQFVENLGRTFATDAMIMDDNGVLYFTALERDAITARLPSGELTVLTADERLVWPDSLAIHNGLLYITTARIHEVGLNNPEGPIAEGPFRLLRVPLLDVKH